MYPLSNSALNASSLIIQTPIGSLWAMANNTGLCYLKFIDSDISLSLENNNKENKILRLVVQQMREYFEGRLHTFSIPLDISGTVFQKLAWKTLCSVPYGDITTYSKQAQMMGRDNAFRAVGNANARNPICIIIPCHRIVRCDAQIGGYAYGMDRKQWLIAHEAKHRPRLESSI